VAFGANGPDAIVPSGPSFLFLAGRETPSVAH
jgi:hypothetical protein